MVQARSRVEAKSSIALVQGIIGKLGSSAWRQRRLTPEEHERAIEELAKRHVSPSTFFVGHRKANHRHEATVDDFRELERYLLVAYGKTDDLDSDDGRVILLQELIQNQVAFLVQVTREAEEIMLREAAGVRY